MRAGDASSPGCGRSPDRPPPPSPSRRSSRSACSACTRCRDRRGGCPAARCGFGDVRACQPNADAARVMTSMARGSVRRFRRNSTGSTPAAAASSSVKPSTANTFAILPGARRFDSCSGVSLSQCATTRTLSACVRRIAVLRDGAGALAVILREAGGVGGEQRARARRRVRHPHLGFPRRRCVRLASSPGPHVEQLLRTLGIPADARPGASTARERAVRWSSTAAAASAAT